MGRRALRKIAPELDLSHHLRSRLDLPERWTSEAIFGNSAPLEIEVGTGKGLFLAASAVEHPDRNFVGIEISRKYARFAAAKLATRQVGNGVVVHGDANVCFHEDLVGRSLSAVHVYFPDPWWKKRHHRRRVMNESFLRDVDRALHEGGRLHFWTDVQEYFTASLEVIHHVTSLRGPLDVPELPAEHDMDYRTNFERRARLHNQNVYRAEFQA